MDYSSAYEQVNKGIVNIIEVIIIIVINYHC